jgi:hypothetical protein
MASVIRVYPKQPTGFASGSLTVGTIVVQGPDIPVARGHQVVLTCPTTNAASVYVGDSGVTTDTGLEIEPGAGAMIAVDNVSKLYFISSAADQIIKYAVERGD